MRNNLRVTFNLDHLSCYDEGDGWGSAEPYMWTVYFKIDGTTCHLNDSLMLEGTATVYTTPGSHGNLGDTDVDGGDTVPIPSSIGTMDMTLIPIPVPDFVKQLGTDDVQAIAGCIIVLMEEDNVSDDGAESGHNALNSGIQNALNGLIPTLGFTKQEISDEDINNLTSKIQSQIEDAVENQQNGFENFWSWLNSDDTIGTFIQKFSGDQLIDQNPITLNKRWTNGNGDWELFGNINTLEVPSCPADILNRIFDEPSREKSMQSMYDFRDKDMKKYPGLNVWWEIAKRNSHYLKLALNNKEASKAAKTLFKNIPEILKNRGKSLSENDFNAAVKVLNSISLLNPTDRQSRKDIKRSIDALRLLQGKSPNDIFKFLNKVKPARHPLIEGIDNNLRIKND